MKSPASQQSQSEEGMASPLRKPQMGHLDWSCKVDVRRNGERTIQTEPIPIMDDLNCSEESGQHWAFMIELGYNEQMKS